MSEKMLQHSKWSICVNCYCLCTWNVWMETIMSWIEKLFFPVPALSFSLSLSLCKCRCSSAFRISDCYETSGEKKSDFFLSLSFSCKICQPHAAAHNMYIWHRNCVDWAGIRLASTSKNGHDDDDKKREKASTTTEYLHWIFEKAVPAASRMKKVHLTIRIAFPYVSTKYVKIVNKQKEKWKNEIR